MADQESLATTRDRYRASSRKDRSRILDALTAATGYHRKHAIRLLAQSSNDQEKVAGAGRPRIYDEAVLEALIPVWKASDLICGKRLEAALPHLVESMEHHGHLDLDPEVRQRLLAASAATLDRLLKPARGAASGRRILGRGRRIPARTSTDRNRHEPGFLEVGLVVHHGDPLAGTFNYSLVATDACTGWTEAVQLRTLDQSLATKGLESIAGQLPFRILGIDSDHSTAPIREALTQYCAARSIESTRSRARRKTDHADIHPQNKAFINRLIDEEHHSSQIRPYLYGMMWQYVNCFQPSFKLMKEPRNGSVAVKRYGTPATPYDRVMRQEAVNIEARTILRKRRAELDPVALLHAVREAEETLATMLFHDLRLGPNGESLAQFLTKQFDQSHHDETLSTQSERE